MLQSIPDVPDWGLGTLIGVAWAVVLVAAIREYRTGSRSRHRLYQTICVGAFWMAYGLLQIPTALVGAAAIAVVTLAVGCVPVGIVAGIRWRRSDDPDGGGDTTG